MPMMKIPRNGPAAMGALTIIGLKMYVRENVIAYDALMLGGFYHHALHHRPHAL